MDKIIIEKFNNNFKITKNTCWLWMLSLDKDGYGRITLPNRKEERAHRLSYRIHKGDIPKDKIVCHKCDTPRCVNPNHLWLGTYKENNLDAMKKGRKPPLRGNRHNMSKLTYSKVSAIRQRYKTKKETHKEIAKKHNVCRETISQILSGKTWLYKS
jgi:hypothetical protein